MLSTFLLAGALSIGALVLADLAGRLAIRRFEIVDPDAIELPGRRFWLRGTAVHYRERGSGPPVLLVHGFGASTFSFRYLEATLSRQFRVISIDLPGFGYADRSPSFPYSRAAYVKLLVEFLARLGIARIDVIGHSLGGAVAQQLAAEHPSLVERVVLVAAPSTTAHRARSPGLLVAEFAAIFQGLLAQFPAVYRRLGRAMVAEPSFFDATEAEGYQAPLRVRGTAAAIRRLMVALPREAPVDLRTVQAPVLLLWGQQDRVVKPAVAAEILAALPTASYVEIPAAGHLVVEEQPEAAGRAILEFLTGGRASVAASEPAARVSG